MPEYKPLYFLLKAGDFIWPLERRQWGVEMGIIIFSPNRYLVGYYSAQKKQQTHHFLHL